MTFAEFAAQMPLFQTKSLGDGISLIMDVLDVGMYLIEGTERAALLDTGLGIGELAPVIHALTRLPVTVYLTHGHVDHGGGLYGFEKVFVPEKDRNLLTWQTRPQLRRDFASAYDSRLLEISDLMAHMPYRQTTIHVCHPGETIDLGGRKLSIVDLRGHTQGSVGFYDSQTGWLFAGDGCNNATFLFLRESTTLMQYRQTLCRLREQWLPQISRILLCHGPRLEAPLSMIDELITCCDRVTEGSAYRAPFIIPYAPFQNGAACWAAEGENQRRAYDGGFGNLIYCAQREEQKKEMSGWRMKN